jgi:hypothetical protein
MANRFDGAIKRRESQRELLAQELESQSNSESRMRWAKRLFWLTLEVTGSVYLYQDKLPNLSLADLLSRSPVEIIQQMREQASSPNGKWAADAEAAGIQEPERKLSSVAESAKPVAQREPEKTVVEPLRVHREVAAPEPQPVAATNFAELYGELRRRKDAGKTPRGSDYEVVSALQLQKLQPPPLRPGTQLSALDSGLYRKAIAADMSRIPPAAGQNAAPAEGKYLRLERAPGGIAADLKESR